MYLKKGLSFSAGQNLVPKPTCQMEAGKSRPYLPWAGGSVEWWNCKQNCRAYSCSREPICHSVTTPTDGEDEPDWTEG
jgi:hypothetical protein